VPDDQYSFGLEEIISALSVRKQRATYGAVADLLGLPARSLMTGRQKSPKNSWIVAAHTGAPTGYEETEIDPDCLRQTRAGETLVIRDSVALKRWLGNL